jgi:ABC-2 type transport system permease protein
MLVVLALVTIAGYLSFSDFSFMQAVKEVATMFGAILFVGLIYISIGIFLSSLIKSSRTASGVTIAIVFGTFVLGATGTVVENLSFLQYLSPMDWIKTAKLMSEGIRWQEWLIGLIVVIASIDSANVIYAKRDLLV